jgi:hypothetical protein
METAMLPPACPDINRDSRFREAERLLCCSGLAERTIVMLFWSPAHG